MIKKLKFLRRYLVFHVIWPVAFILGCIHPVDPKLVVFAYNLHYKTLPDNMVKLKEIYEKKGYKCVEYSNPANAIQRLLGDICFQFLYAKSKIIFITDNFDPLYAHKPRKGTRVVQLWHACGAFKKWGYSTLDAEWGDSRRMWELFPRHTSYTDVFVSSEYIIPCYSEAFNCPKEIIKPLGVPRTDVFFDKEFVSSGRERLLEAIPEIGNRKVILYAPTFRGNSPTNAHNDKMIDYKSFKETFGKDYALVLKFHPFTLGKENLSEEEKELYGDVVYLCPPEIGIDTAMCAADILISDYSSLIFEYSLLSRPMIFFAYDLDEYEHSRDYYYNYTDFVPGPIVKTSDELLQAVADAAQNGANHKIIDDFRDKFMSACDGGSAQRIADFVEKNN